MAIKLLKFTQFVKESLGLEELDDLLSIGLIDQTEYKKQKLIKQREQYLSSASPEMVKRALETPGAKKLMQLGLHFVSSKVQMNNGTLVFSLDPYYSQAEGWGIGFYPFRRVIMRMTPKKIPLGLYGRSLGSMDIIIKKFPSELEVIEFFNVAMDWAADNIDFEHAKKNPDPKTFKYYTKKRLPK